MRLRFKGRWQLLLAARLISSYGRLVFATIRVRHATPIPAVLSQGPVLLALWHQQIFAVPLLAKPNRPYALVGLMSPSADGQLTRTIAKHYGIGAAVGSSSSQSISGARQLVALAKRGHSLFLTPDGPRGPACIAKPGASELARLTKLPLVPCAAFVKGKLIFKSWDTFWLPLPFARITLAWGEPLPPNATPADLTTALKQLNAKLAKHRSTT